MRPLKLVMSAFGPYADEQTIDFSQLGGRNIFLITGPTGAGKTTIFDAICYAIYGKGSGRDRDGENMRSDFAGEDAVTYVELEFELNGRRYWIKRQPRQLRRKSKGSGFTEQGAEAEFKDLNAADPETVAGIREVNEKIQQVMGITYEQFKQIIMIPQGEFRELLTTESKDREAILQRIFGTEGFKRMQDQLGDMEKGLREEVKSLSGQRDSSIRRLNAEGSEELRLLISVPQLNVAAVMETAQRAIAEDVRQQDALQEQEQAQEMLLTAKQQEIFQAQEVLRKFQELREAAGQKELLENQMPAYEEQEARLVRGRRTLALQVLEDNVRSRRDSAALRQNALTTANGRLTDAAAAMQSAKTLYETQLAQEVDRNLLQERVVLLKGYSEKVQALDAGRKRHGISRVELTQAEQALTEAKTTAESMKTAIKDTTGKLEAARLAAAEFATRSAELQTKRQIAERLQKLQHEHQRLQDCRKQYEEKGAQFKREKEALDKLQNGFEHIQQQFFKGQAGLLAKNLRDGQPCPVCGSQHHPEPAGLAEDAVTEEQLRLAEGQLKKVQEGFEQSRTEFDRITQEGYAQRRVVEELKRELAGSLGDGLDRLEKERLVLFVSEKSAGLAAEIAGLTQLVKQLEQLKTQEAALSETVRSLQEQLTKAEADVESCSGRYTACFAQEQSSASELAKLQQEVPPEFQAEQELVRAIGQAEEAVRLAVQAFKSAEEAWRQAELEYARRVTEAEGCGKALAEAAAELETVEQKLIEEITRAGFAAREEYERAKITEEQVQRLEQDIRSFRESLTLARERFSKAERQTASLAVPDTERLASELAAIQAEKARLNQLRTEVFARSKNNRSTLAAIAGLQAELGDKEQEYGIIAELANTARGNNEEKLSFERYVLAAFFNDIIEAANIRLGKMTGGRYEMSRIAERSKGAAQSGLEISVFDNYTGRARHIKTLSGGESFKASLALALGLADVVQAYAGGISLETMFIDEGFGTLDPESLDNAINCLVELQHSGRLVGIISHVPELKASVDARLEIEAGKDGSKARFYIV